MGNFSLAIDRFVKEAQGKAEIVFRKTALQLSADIIKDTPVDQGTARGNWQPAVNDWPMSSVLKLDKDGNKTVAGVLKTVNELKLGDTFVLVNNLTYINALENGHSAKAPHGMVMRNVARYPGIVEDAVGSLK